MDLAVFKIFSVTEHTKVQFRVQAYNLTNTPRFANPDSDLNHGTFGLINSVQPFSWGQVELGLRFTFYHSHRNSKHLRTVTYSGSLFLGADFRRHVGVNLDYRNFRMSLRPRYRRNF